MPNVLDIYARASRRLKLSPGERAALKTADTLLLAGLSGAAVAVLQALLSGGNPITLRELGQVAIYAGTTAVLTGLVKLFRARGDALSGALASAVESAAGRLPAPPGPPPTLPTMPRYGQPSLSQAQRLDLLRGGSMASGDPSTRPTRAVSAATSAPRQPLAPQASDEPPNTPAPSQRVVAPSAAEGDEENGPPTVQLPVVRPGAMPGAMPPTAPASPSAWLTQEAAAPAQ